MDGWWGGWGGWVGWVVGWGGWVGRRGDGWVGGWVGSLGDGWVDEWVNVYVEWVSGLNGQVDGWVDFCGFEFRFKEILCFFPHFHKIGLSVFCCSVTCEETRLECLLPCATRGWSVFLLLCVLRCSIFCASKN